MQSVEQEKDLLERIAQGEPKAWEEFVELYGRLIYYAVQKTLKLKGIRCEKEEVQGIFHSLFIHLAEDRARRLLKFSGKGKCSLATWIRTISVHHTIDVIRAQARSAFYVSFEEVNEADFDASWSSPVRDPEKELAERENEKKLKNALLELSSEERAFLNLYLNGVDASKLAKLYKAPVKNIYSRLAQLKEKIKGIIEGG